MKLLRRLCYITTPMALCAALWVTPARAQVVPAAFGPGQSLWAGAEYSNVSASFPYQSGQRLAGVGGFVDLNLNPHLGLEGDVRFLRLGGFEGTTESSYLAGPRLFFLERTKFRGYGKLLLGAGRIHYPYAIGNGSYLALAAGAGAEYALNRRWRLRGEYEYQIWFNSPGFASEPQHRLTPNGFQLGLAYRIFR